MKINPNYINKLENIINLNLSSNKVKLLGDKIRKIAKKLSDFKKEIISLKASLSPNYEEVMASYNSVVKRSISKKSFHSQGHK